MRAVSEGIAGRIARRFIDNPVVPILILFGVSLGAFALTVVPREEEPQIRACHIPEGSMAAS